MSLELLNSYHSSIDTSWLFFFFLKDQKQLSAAKYSREIKMATMVFV